MLPVVGIFSNDIKQFSSRVMEENFAVMIIVHL